MFLNFPGRQVMAIKATMLGIINAPPVPDKAGTVINPAKGGNEPIDCCPDAEPDPAKK
jgi:hypothetical protein